MDGSLTHKDSDITGLRGDVDVSFPDHVLGCGTPPARMTCPQCREQGRVEPVAVEHQGVGTETIIVATCPVCAWQARYKV